MLGFIVKVDTKQYYFVQFDILINKTCRLDFLKRDGITFPALYKVYMNWEIFNILLHASF